MNILRLRYEAYCEGCGEIVGYTNHKPEPGDAIVSKGVFLPDGKPAVAGMPLHIKNKGMHRLKFLIRDNPFFCPTCGGTGEVNADEKDRDGNTRVGVNVIPCPDCMPKPEPTEE